MNMNDLETVSYKVKNYNDLFEYYGDMSKFICEHENIFSIEDQINFLKDANKTMNEFSKFVKDNQTELFVMYLIGGMMNE
ncbi:hypothetical protein D9O40_16790 [Clostridium autoethanogenum]|uniref:Uncharacterized protein n=1 Tax=Clostridium autoethanogenum TaxID=84023 RepID=A0A3M0SAB0_9CLOT|nr:hypothetical protein [Clostridium autoethanogenum]RMC95195.1 hypothetical protein D9O40_16790 [Clostridium autoethanogenum]